jgi:Flp pilus assembly protein TadD
MNPETTKDTPILRTSLRIVNMIACCSVVLLAGCAALPGKQDAAGKSSQEIFTDLYDGKATTAYATELPVASSEEARLRGDLALKQGDIDLALYQYIQALELDGKDPDILARIGAIHASRDNLQLAGLAYQRALVIEPDHVASLTGLGLILIKKRNHPDAREMLERSLSLDAEQWRPHNALGIVADLENDYLRAISHYQAALRLKPGLPMLLNNLGYSHYLAGDRATAIDLFRQALDRNPDYRRAWQNLGLVYAREGNYTAAVDAFSHAMDLAKAYNDVGYLSMLDGQYKVSEAFLQEAVNLSPSYYKTANQNIVRVRNLRSANETEQ